LYGKLALPPKITLTATGADGGRGAGGGGGLVGTNGQAGGCTSFVKELPLLHAAVPRLLNLVQQRPVLFPRTYSPNPAHFSSALQRAWQCSSPSLFWHSITLVEWPPRNVVLGWAV
jgi:hypothetical protein